MKGLGTFLKILKFSKLLANYIETLSQSWNMEETFSPSQDTTEYVCSGGKLLRK